MIKFLTIDCPKCDILEDKLKEKGLEYEAIKDENYFDQKGLRGEAFPFLELEDGTILNYLSSVRYINNINNKENN